MPKTNTLEQNPLSQPEAQRLLDFILDKKYRSLVLLGLNSGISLPEAFALKANDITAMEQVLWIMDASKKKHRTVIVPKKVLEYIKHCLNGNLKADVILFDIPLSTLMDELPTLSKNAIGKPIGWACIRATYAKLAIEAGHPIDLVSENTGLSRKFISEQIQTVPELKREIVNLKPLVVIK